MKKATLFLILSAMMFTLNSHARSAKVIALSNTFTLDTRSAVAVDDENGEYLPTVFQLRQNYPNPFNPATSIRYDIPRLSYVSIAIYSILGKKIKTLAQAQVDSGNYEALWDGTDDSGNKVSSGIYFCRMETNDGFAEARKMVLIR